MPKYGMLKPFFQLFNVLAILVALLWTGLVAGASIPFMRFHLGMAHWFHRLFAQGCCKIAGIRVHLKGLENLDTVPGPEGYLLAPNHASMVDILVMAALPVNFFWISKREVAYLPFLGWAMALMGHYFVRRRSGSSDVNITMKRVEADVRKGRNILVFPEGTRTRTGKLGPLKKGAFRVAQNSGGWICPVALKGTYEIAPPGTFPSKWGHEVSVEFGKPYPIPADAELESVMEDYRQRLVALLESESKR